MKALLLRLLTVIATPRLQVWGARLLLRFGPRTLSLGNRLFVFHWQDVSGILRQDQDFLIAPVNGQRIEAVSGPFILGMDRSPELLRQRSCVYQAMQDADFGLIDTTMEAAINQCLSRRGDGQVEVVNDYARLVAGRTARAYFGVSGPDEASTLRVMRAVFHETSLNVTDDPEVRRAGIAAGAELSDWTAREIARRRSAGDLARRDVLGRLLHHASSLGFNDVSVGWMLSGLIVGAVDTTATVVANVVKELADDPALLAAVAQDVNQPDRLPGWCWEALRRRPHNPLVVRQAGAAARVAGRAVKPGTLVYAVTLAAMQGPAAFPNPELARPDRSPDLYMHFGHGLHQCAGRVINARQIPQLVGRLVAGGILRAEAIRYAGPFPDRLFVTLKGATPS